MNNPLCPQCNAPLTLKRTDTVAHLWHFDANKQSFLDDASTESNGLVCANCEKQFTAAELAVLGMAHHIPDRRKGFGTNFHSVYSTDASLYHSFSCAEDHEGIIRDAIVAAAPHGGVLLDVGCGTGKYADQLSGHFTRVYALDIAKELLSFARNTASAKNIEYLWSSASTIPLLDESVDVVMSTWGSFSPNEAVPEMIRALKPGGSILRIGTCAVDDLTRLYKTFDTDVIENVTSYFESVGFNTTYSDITITFPTIAEAQRVLSGITGADAKTIQSPILTHRIIISTYKKPAA